MCVDRKEVVMWMMRTMHRHKAFIESRLCAAKVGIYPAQHRILMHLAANPGINQKELADILCVSPATVTISVKKLIKSGYINKESQESDNRYNLLTITDKGREVIEKSIKVFDKTYGEMFTGFTDCEIQQLKVYLKRIYANLDE